MLDDLLCLALGIHELSEELGILFSTDIIFENPDFGTVDSWGAYLRS